MAVPSAPQTAAQRAGLHFNISPLLLSSIVAAVAATVALVVVAVIESQSAPPPPRGTGPPPPPPSDVMLILTTAAFVMAWLAVIIALCRDQILRRMAQLEERLVSWTTEYGEQRETDGYIHGLRKPISPGPAGDVRQLHPRPATE